jgi:hypothetical protein
MGGDQGPSFLNRGGGIAGVGGTSYNPLLGESPQLTMNRLKLLYGPQTWFNPEDRKFHQEIMEDLLRRMNMRMQDVPQDVSGEQYRGGGGQSPWFIPAA